jgi:hypothetical protein
MQINSLLQLIVFFYILTTTYAILIDTCNCTLPSFKGTIDLTDPDYCSHPDPVTPPQNVHYTITSRNKDRLRLYTMVISKTNHHKLSSGPRHHFYKTSVKSKSRRMLEISKIPPNV